MENSSVACGIISIEIDYSDYSRVYVFSIKYRCTCSNILLKKHKLHL